MGLLTKILGGSIGEMAQGVAGAIDRFVQTKEEKEAAELLRQRIQQEPDRWQAEINKVEAGHRSMFVAGWRPAIGWICAFALAWGWILGPFLSWALPGKPMPAIELGEAISLIMALLGLGALRSYEKKTGISR